MEKLCENGEGDTIKKLERKSAGQASRNVLKKKRLSSHELGSDCKCSRYECFEKVTLLDRQRIIKKFNKMPSRDEQNLYLASLITVMQVKKHRPRQNTGEAKFHDSAYNYQVRIGRKNNFIDVPICQRAFLSLHGITGRRLQTIQESLKKNGIAPKDMRGKYRNARKPPDVLEVVKNHISSFKAQNISSEIHSDVVYLPETLSLRKMYFMYKDLELPDVSYEYYRRVFNKDFNIKFVMGGTSLEKKIEETVVRETKDLQQDM